MRKQFYIIREIEKQEVNHTWTVAIVRDEISAAVLLEDGSGCLCGFTDKLQIEIPLWTSPHSYTIQQVTVVSFGNY